jgi:hypothetical protein
MRALAGLVSVIAVGCGSGSKRPVGPPPFAAGATVHITDGDQIYDALNTTDCVRWPSDDVKKRAGRDGWKSFHPTTGNEGKVLATLSHCDRRTQVVLVEIGAFVVPVTRAGVEAIGADAAGAGALAGVVTALDDPFGGAMYGDWGGEWIGGDWGGDPCGGGWGADPCGGIGGVVIGGYGYAGMFGVGDSVEITDVGHVFPDLNTFECVAWPDATTKKNGGKSAWGKYAPSNGETGTVLAVSPHCHDASIEVLILDVGGKIVPIGAAGVAYW